MFGSVVFANKGKKQKKDSVGKKGAGGSGDPLIDKLSNISQIIDFTTVKQCFLLDQAEFLGNQSINGKNTTGFRHSLILSDDDIGGLLSEINKPESGVSKVMSMRNVDYARFVPKIQLYKILYSDNKYVGEAPIPFSTDSSATIESILSSAGGRGDDVGIVEFSVNFEHQNAFAASRMVNGSLKIAFQNGESLTKDRVLRMSSKGGGNTSFRFSDFETLRFNRR